MSSQAYDFRDALKDSIVGAAIGLSAEQIVLDRETDIFSEIDTVVAQEGGLCLTIAVMEGDHPNPESEQLFFNMTFLLTLWMALEFRTDTLPEETIHQGLMKHVHHLELPSLQLGPDCRQRLEVRNFRVTPDESYLRRDTSVGTRLYIP